MKKTILAGLVGALFASAACAFDPFVVKDIRVEGIQRTEAGTVFNYLPVRVGDQLTEEMASKAIKALFATGFFKDVRLEIESDVLIVVLEERPAIASVDFVGLKLFKKEELIKSLRDIGLAESRIYDRAMVEKAELELKRQYLNMGYYGSQVTTTITPLERNRIGISFKVEEGEIAKIKQINIVGAKSQDEKDLLELLVLRTPGWFTWYTKNDQYSKQKLSGDLESLRSYYMNRGYLEFNIDSTQISISPDKQDIYITVNITEGEKYTVSGIKLAGEIAVPEDELAALVKLRPGDVFSREKMTETTKAISDRLGNEGYAFANVNSAPEVDKEKQQVAFTIFIDPGRRVYVRRVNVAGNTKTRDEVVRREMRQMEGSWYEGDKIAKSKVRIDRLGYFDEVTLETPAVPGTTDQVDVNVAVKEKPTGSMMLGAGFSSTDKLMLSGSIMQQNLFGSGKTIGVQLNTSKINKVYSFSYTDPYATVDGILQGFDVYHRTLNTMSLSLGYYNSSSTGAGVRYGVPISEDNFISLGLAVDATSITIDPVNSPRRYIDFINKNGGSMRTLLSSAGWAKETIDSRLYPTQGGVDRLNGELSLPGGNVRYYRASYQSQRFFPMTRDITLALNGEVTKTEGYSGKDLPFFKNVYAGGIGSVRGYETYSLGPVDPTNQQRLGGTRRVVGNAEFLFAMPGMGLDRSIRLGAFMDAGQVWGTGEKMSLGDLRYSTGLSMTWNSPFGPLKFSFANPMNKKDGDKVQRLQFQMGTTF